jgi:hypothetical protein
MKTNILLTVAFLCINTVLNTCAAATTPSAAKGQHPDVPTNPVALKRLLNEVLHERDDLRAQLAGGGGGAGPALPSEIRALVQCATSGDNTPYINLAKAKIKEILASDAPGAVISAATPNKAALLQQLNAFIDTLNNGNLGVAIPGAGAGGANPAANEVKTLNALKCAIDVAMVQKVNAKMDELGVAGAQPIKEALLAVFAGR